MESLSSGDLYYELGFHRWLIEGMIPKPDRKPGRIVRFSRLDDPVIDLLDQSDVPQTADSARGLADSPDEGRRALFLLATRATAEETEHPETWEVDRGHRTRVGVTPKNSGFNVRITVIRPRSKD
jgi:hypothetical protein